MEALNRLSAHLKSRLIDLRRAKGQGWKIISRTYSAEALRTRVETFTEMLRARRGSNEVRE
jgi:benzoyl-CoA reductase/2-hydroxyglutaryl-CoA dehydratase subunit BcrC/BadD/HgdB